VEFTVIDRFATTIFPVRFLLAVMLSGSRYAIAPYWLVKVTLLMFSSSFVLYCEKFIVPFVYHSDQFISISIIISRVVKLYASLVLQFPDESHDVTL